MSNNVLYVQAECIKFEKCYEYSINYKITCKFS